MVSTGRAMTIPDWAAKGMCAVITDPAYVGSGVVDQAVSFPFSTEIIRSAAKSGCEGLTASLLKVLTERGNSSHARSIAARSLGVIDLGEQKAAVVSALLDR